MKKESEPNQTIDPRDEPPTELRPGSIRGGERGRYARRFGKDVVMVPLDPDVAAAYPNAAAVNDALRQVMHGPNRNPT